MDKRNSDKNLIKVVQNSNQKEEIEQSLLILYERHKKICFRVGIKYKVNLIDEAILLIYDAAKEYEMQKSKFSTFLWNRCFYKCMKLIKQNEINKKNRILSDEYYQRNEIEQIKYNYNVKELINKVSDVRAKKVLQIRYLQGEAIIPFKEIAKMLGYSYTTIIKDYNRAIGEIKKYIEVSEK